MTYAQFRQRWPINYGKPYLLQQTTCDDIIVCLYETWDKTAEGVFSAYEVVMKRTDGRYMPRLIARVGAYEMTIESIEEAENIFKFTVEQCNKHA